MKIFSPWVCLIQPLGARGAISGMDEELSQCLNGIPSFVARLEEQRHTVDLNLLERLIMRAELFLELLRVLTGKFTVSFVCMYIL